LSHAPCSQKRIEVTSQSLKPHKSVPGVWVIAVNYTERLYSCSPYLFITFPLLANKVPKRALMPLFFYRKGEKVAQRIYNEQPLCAFVALVVKTEGHKGEFGGFASY
jgi:hypothetical protein